MFFTSASAAGVVAPAQATVVSTFEKLTTPGTDAFVTGACAPTTFAESARATAISALRMVQLLKRGGQCEAALLRAIDAKNARSHQVRVADEIRGQLGVHARGLPAHRLRQQTGEEGRRQLADGELHALLQYLVDRRPHVRAVGV